MIQFGREHDLVYVNKNKPELPYFRYISCVRQFRFNCSPAYEFNVSSMEFSGKTFLKKVWSCEAISAEPLSKNFKLGKTPKYVQFFC